MPSPQKPRWTNIQIPYRTSKSWFTLAPSTHAFKGCVLSLVYWLIYRVTVLPTLVRHTFSALRFCGEWPHYLGLCEREGASVLTMSSNWLSQCPFGFPLTLILYHTFGDLSRGFWKIFQKFFTRLMYEILPRQTSHLTTVTLLSSCPLDNIIIPHREGKVNCHFAQIFTKIRLFFVQFDERPGVGFVKYLTMCEREKAVQKLDRRWLYWGLWKKC